MSNSSTGNAANAAKNLLNQAQGLAGPGSPTLTGFQSSLGTAQANQASELSGSMNNINNLQTLSATGGYDPTQLSGLTNQTANMTATGGYDPTQLNQINSGYTDLATTGGYTPQQAQQFVQQATEGTQSTYGALEDQAKRAQVATGGLGTGGGLSQMARQLSQAQGANTLNAEVALNQNQTGNKLAGLGGESNVAGQVAGSKLAAQGQQLGLASNVAGNTLQGTETAGNQLNQVYNTTTGQVTALGNQILQTLGLDFSTQAEAGNILAKISNNPSMFQQILGMAGGGLSSAAGAFGGASGGGT
jgi:hypothetical protein